MRPIQIGAALLLATLVVSAQPPLPPQASQRAVERIDGREAVGGEVLVRLRAPFAGGDVADLQALTDAEPPRAVGRTGLRRLRSRSLTAAAMLRRLANHPRVLYAEPNYVVHALAEPPDPRVPDLWGLLNTGQAVNGGLAGLAGADINAVDAWDISIGSTAHVVAVIDTGLDYTHADLVANVWTAPAAFTVSLGGTTITCPAGSHGFNAIAMTCDPMDDHHHGTHVAGTIGAAAGNGLGVVGVNWVTRLMGLKFLDASGSGTIADAITAIDFAIQARDAFAATGAADVRVLSNSWGGRAFSQALADEIAVTDQENMLFVAAAGNDGFSNDIVPLYPASYAVPNVVAVAATTNTDTRAWFSNYGAASVHLGAPGVDILSTVPGDAFAFSSGTSMATPHVSGAAALVLSQCALDTPGLKAALLDTAERLPSLESYTITGGRLDVHSAIRSCMGPPAAPSDLAASAGDAQIVLTWTGGAGATGYNVRRSLTSGGPYESLASVTASTFADSTTVNGTTYYYVVSATNSQGESADSNEASATPKAPSDLVVSPITVPSVAGAGETLTVAVTTKNNGPAASAPTRTRVYLSRNASIDASDIPFDGHQEVPALPAGASAPATVSLEVPDTVAVGLYFVIAKADADGQEAETSEANNTAARVVNVGPDLVVSTLTVPAAVNDGTSFAVSDTVKNRGGGQAGASAVKFYLSTNAAFDAADVPLDGARAVPALAPNASSAGSTMLIVPSGTPTGSYYLLARADADGQVAETYESNNYAARTIKIGGDLKVSSLGVPSKAGSGETLVVTDTTANAGAGAVGASTTRFYLSSDVFLTADDTVLPGSRSVPALAAGASSTGTTGVSIPTGLTPGRYYVIAKADADGGVVETQEGNNTALRATMVGPDLRVSGLSVVYTVVAGSTITVTDTVTNQGAEAAGSSTTRFFLSANVLFDAGDALLPGERAVPALAAGASSTGSTLVTIPSGTPPGQYYLFGQADSDGAVAESYETNNASLRAIKVVAGS